MITSLAIAAIAVISLATGFLCGMSWGTKKDVPLKRTIEQMNAAEFDAAERRRLEGHVENLQDLHTRIYVLGVTSTSGTARKMAQIAKAGVKKP